MIDVQPTLDRIDAVLAECDAEQLPPPLLPAVLEVTTPADATPARCMAHGAERCAWCSLNPASCADEYGQCAAYARDGMHWDTCPNRVRGPEPDSAEKPWTVTVDEAWRHLGYAPPAERRRRWSAFPWSRR